MEMFPQGLFYILSRKHGFALDVYDGGTSEGTNLIVWPQKFQDSDNQLWSFEDGRLINKKSGHVMDISSSAFKKDKTIVQKKRKPNKQSQEWIYDQGFICSKEYLSLVLDIRGDSPKGGAQVLLYKRKDADNLNQLWQFEPYQQFEHALNMATTSLPLHKKEGFGQPRLGYAAEVGVPPELTKIPENNKIAGIGNNVSATPSTNGPVDNSRIDPALAQYGSFYGGTTTSPPPAQPVQRPSNNIYPPPPGPPPPANDSYPPQPGPVPSSTSGYASSPNYPPPPLSPPSNTGYPGDASSRPPAPSYPGAGSSGTGYPVQQQPSPSNYQSNTGYPPAAPSAGYPQPSTSSGYPPSSPSNNNYGYPPSIQQLSTSPPGPGYPPTSYPPSNQGGYPSPSNFPQPSTSSNTSAFPQPSNYNQQQQAGGMPNSTNYGGLPPPPPLPGNRPPQDQQYGYPNYPQ